MSASSPPPLRKTTILPEPFIAFDDPAADSTENLLDTVGGKGGNLVKLTLAGFPVPKGFLVPTSVYRRFVQSNGLDVAIAEALRRHLPREGDDDPQALETASSEIRAAFSSFTIDPELSSALERGLHWLAASGEDNTYDYDNDSSTDNKRADVAVPVAIRSSATAEDLPDLSFAGQQDTYLNVIGTAAAGRAVVDCWSSLWTARAIGYRSRNSIDHGEVALCVVVQAMAAGVASSGVLFTANPLTGNRSEVTIDATIGLGEALVGGLVQPDHYVVDTGTTTGLASEGGWIITRKTLGSKSVQIHSAEGGGVATTERKDGLLDQFQALSDRVVLKLARLGKEIEERYDGFPQDVEFAVSESGDISILQSRPITSLYPLPARLPREPLQVLLGFHLVQGVFEPFTPLGHSTIREIVLGGGRIMGLRLRIQEQTTFVVSGLRTWVNVTPILRHPLGQKAYLAAVKGIDPSVPGILKKVLADDHRIVPYKSAAIPWRLLRFFLGRIPRLLKCWIWPEHYAQKTLAMFDEHVTRTALAIGSSLPGRTYGSLPPLADLGKAVERLSVCRTFLSDVTIPIGLPAVIAGMVPFFGVLKRFSEEVAEKTGDARFRTLYLEIAKGIPNNVTTEMDICLWRASQAIQDDRESLVAFEKCSAKDLAAQYAAETLPAVAQRAVHDFLNRYGARGLGEIDIGRTRWAEDAEHIMGVLQSYSQIRDPDQSPEAVFARGAGEAVRAAHELETAVRERLSFGLFKAAIFRWAVRRYRVLGGLRESPKFFIIRMMGLMRAGLLASGKQMERAGWLSARDDLLYLELTELESLVKEVDGWKEGDPVPASLSSWRDLIEERRELRARELRRKRIPRILLSDGTAFYEGIRSPEDSTESAGHIVGDPVSPGAVEGVVRVVFDPLGSRLKPGEILVCPGTDPAWTPLFLAANGLVMEVGGMMTHGSVVAREYGIPAVVGVHDATKRLETGQRIRLDGSSGIVEVLE